VPQFQLGQWEGHVLASLPFYMLLLPLLLSLLKSRVASKATSALQDLAKVGVRLVLHAQIGSLPGCITV
jgi:hypothetical protein